MDSKLLVNQAALLNAEGSHALTLGDAMAAHYKLKQALQVLSQATDSCIQQAPVIKEEGWYRSIVSSAVVPGLNETSQGGDFYVCNNALLFHFLDEDVIDSAAVAICCHCVMFNMALTLHQRGMLTGTERNFVSAGRLYEQCLRLSAEIEGSVDDLNIMAIAIWNNLAQLHYMLGDYDMAIENLKTVQGFVSDTDLEECVSPGLAHAVKLDNVILNVLVTSRPTTAPCA
ncbi:expressed unknown protein [Seminavis robusta]|uniref:Uncharacterized protein n=1 Tax=Seminavis robusta TaxID=568900 RepID=A0A9N8E722_9STRA|nr:expressed unknown protein [Seminavis robusta]|eukprot:Sro747_g196590.1 n/a (229) ;mRNA; f:42632-43318